MPVISLVKGGSIPVTRDASPPISYNEGLACDKDGRLIITENPTAIIYSGGIPRSPEGYLVTSGGGTTTGGPGGGGSSGAFFFPGVEVQVLIQVLPTTTVPIGFYLVNYV